MLIPGALFECDPDFTPVKIYRKRIKVSRINPFLDPPERTEGIGGMAYDLWRIRHPAARIHFKMLKRIAGIEIYITSKDRFDGAGPLCLPDHRERRDRKSLTKNIAHCIRGDSIVLWKRTTCKV